MPPPVAAEYATFHSEWLKQKRHAQVQFDRPGTLHKQRLLELLTQNEFVNLVGHHRYLAATPSQSGFPLPGGDLMSASDLVEAFQHGLGLPPSLVFSMGCESGLTMEWTNWPDTGAIHGLVDAALQVGIRHYIGTLIKFPAHPSGRFFEPFYEALAKGHTVGEAVRRVRLAFRPAAARQDWHQGGTVLGLSLISYGDPSAPYFSASGQRTGSSPTVLCEEPEGQSFCGRAVSSEDRGFAQRRCLDHLRGLTCAAGHAVENYGDLKKCSSCDNLLCPKCSGWGKQLCWQHCCFQGHEIVADIWQVCPDPQKNHPGEKRSVCPLDNGWRPGGPMHCSDC